jgi:hypothetical protein
LKKKLRAFVKADIIEQGTSFFTYQAVQDNIFDKVFRGVYQEEIDGFEPEKIKDEYKELYKKLEGAHNKLKGDFAEYFIIKNLRYKAHKQNSLYISMMNNLPEDFKFVSYPSIWSAWFKTGLHFLDSLHFSEIDLTDKYQEVIYSTHP